MSNETPDYYKGKTGLQPLDLIDDFNLNFALGNVIKGRKDNESKLEDLEKASAYLSHEIMKQSTN